MENDNYQIKLIGSALAGVIGGLLLGSYIWGNRTDNTPLSDHFSLLSRILEEIEKMKPHEIEDLKERINDILNAIESGYVKAEK
jgi:hypothetical protein